MRLGECHGDGRGICEKNWHWSQGKKWMYLMIRQTLNKYKHCGLDIFENLVPT